MTIVRPLEDRVVIKALEAKETSAGGIVLPDLAKDKPTEGVIVAVGPGRVSPEGKRVVPNVKVGQYVMYGRYSGTEIKIPNAEGELEEHTIMREGEIYAVFDKEED